MNPICQAIAGHKIVPVIKLNREEDALPLAESLLQGGLPVAEITFRTQAAAGSIRKVSKAYPDLIVGAGTVTNLDQAKIALQAGAKFIVTPGFSRSITEFCLDQKLPIFPGACTPSEIMCLMEYELPIAKFFPAEQFGGLAAIKALAGPFPNMLFMPTGGISTNNILEYLAFKKIIACGGSWMVSDKFIAEGKFDEIARLVQDAVAQVKKQ